MLRVSKLHMQQKYYIPIIIIVILVVVSGLYIFQKKGDYNHQVSISQKALDNSDPDICRQSKSYVFDGGDYIDNVSQPEAENECYYIYAKEKLDITVCDRITPDRLPKLEKCGADEQYAACIYEIQKVLNSFSKENCDKINSRETGCGSWYLGECSEEVVKATGDISICDEYFEKYTGNWNGCTAAYR